MTLSAAGRAGGAARWVRIRSLGRLEGTSGAAACVVGAAALLSTSYTLTKVALMDVPPFTIGLLRFTAAALLLRIWVRSIRRTPPATGPDRRRLALGGVLGVTLYFAIENLGVEMAGPTDAALLVAAYPAVTVLLELCWYRRRTNARVLLGLLMAIGGVYLIVGTAATGGSTRWAGDLLLVISGFVWAAYNFVTRSLSTRYETLVILYYQAAAGAVGFIPLALLEASRWSAWTHPANTTGALAGLVLMCSIVGLGLYARGLRNLSASAAVGLLNLVPVFGLIFAFAVLREPVGYVQLLGGTIVICAVTITSRATERTTGS